MSLSVGQVVTATPVQVVVFTRLAGGGGLTLAIMFVLVIMLVFAIRFFTRLKPPNLSLSPVSPYPLPEA